MRLILWTCDRCKKESRTYGDLVVRTFQAPTGHFTRHDCVENARDYDLCKECAEGFNSWFLAGKVSA